MFSLRNKANNVDRRLRKCCVFIKDDNTLTAIQLKVSGGRGG